MRDEFLRDGRYPPVPEKESDGVVQITITRYILTPLGYDAYLFPISYKLRIIVDLRMAERATNRELWTEKDLEGSLTYPNQILAGGQTEGQAQATIWTVLAPMIVSRVVDGFGAVGGARLDRAGRRERCAGRSRTPLSRMELRPPELVKEWQAGKFRPVYYFFGEESAAKADAVLKLKALFKADDFNLCEFSGEPNSEAPAAVAEALTLPVFADKRLVIVRSPKLPAEARAIYAEYLKSPSPATTLILLSEDRRADKKDALATAAAEAGAACIFSPLTDEEAAAALTAEAKKAGKTMAPEAAEALIGEAGTDWGILAGELEKLVVYVGEGTSIDAAAALACLGYRKSADPWALEKLAQGRDLKACLGYLREAFADAKPEEVVFRSLAQVRGGYLKQLKAKRLLKAGLPQREIETKLRIFYDNSFFARAARVTEERLRRDLRRCLEVETDLKSKSWLDSKLELERLVVELCTPTRTQAAV